MVEWRGAGSWFQRRGEAYWKERSVIRREDDVGGRTSVTRDEERVGDEKLIIIGVAVRGINDHIRFYSQRVCTAAINTSNTTRTQTGAAER